MAGSSLTWAEIEKLFRRATGELERAARAGEVAVRRERLARAADARAESRELHTRMAQIHRQLAQRHLTAARIHRVHAERLQAFLGSQADGVPQAFMAAVAETSSADSALLSLFGHHQAEALVATSDKTAAAAHDLEATLAEGPGRDAAGGRGLVSATDGTLERRWPLYGPAAARLGIRAAAAVPLGTPGRCLGTLTVFGLQAGHHDGAESLGTVADALTYTMLLGDDGGADGDAAGAADTDDVIHLLLPGDCDHLAVVYQAAGMIAGESGCPIADALAIVRARAFAQDEPVESVAAKVVSRKLRLGSEARI